MLRGLSTTEGVSTTGAQHDVSDHRASVMFNAGHHARGWTLAAATADLAQGIASMFQSRDESASHGLFFDVKGGTCPNANWTITLLIEHSKTHGKERIPPD